MKRDWTKFIRTGGPYGDCTSDYILDLELTCTVRQLVEEILEREEWGSITIFKLNITGIRDQISCEYKHDKIIEGSIPEEIMDKVIYDCRANGGWSLMNYVIRTVEE